MSNWIDAIAFDALPPGEHHVMVIEGTPIAIFNVNSEILAFEDCCTHQGLPLSDGFVEETMITCPFHGAKFCMKTGAVLASPAYEKLKTFATRVEGGLIQVEFS